MTPLLKTFQQLLRMRSCPWPAWPYKLWFLSDSVKGPPLSHHCIGLFFFFLRPRASLCRDLTPRPCHLTSL